MFLILTHYAENLENKLNVRFPKHIFTTELEDVFYNQKLILFIDNIDFKKLTLLIKIQLAEGLFKGKSIVLITKNNITKKHSKLFYKICDASVQNATIFLSKCGKFEDKLTAFPLLHEKWPMISKVKRILILKELSNISIRSEETFAYVFNCSKEEFRKQIS